jgi:segregation and condensation protein A
MKVLELIISGSDFQTVLKEIIVEEGLDPWNIDIVKLSDSLLKYLSQLKEINFRIPARFILVASILLRLKSESLLKEGEEDKGDKEIIDIHDLEILEPPIDRIPYRNITFEELTKALEKVIEKEEKEERIRLNKQRKIEELQRVVEINIEDYIEKVFRELTRINKTSFYELTKNKEVLEIARYFVALLHLATQQKIKIYQENLFDDFYIEIYDITI